MSRMESTLHSNEPRFESPAAGVRVLLVGGHKLERDGLALLLATDAALRVVADDDDPGGAFAHVIGPAPDVVLVDVDRAPERAQHMLEQVRALAGQARLLVLTASADRELAGRLVLGGARGVVSKDRPGEHLLQAIRKVHDGELWVDRATTAQIIADVADTRSRQVVDPVQAKIALLTPREREVVALVAKGHSNKAIAERMQISNNTVRHHLTSIFAKLGINDRLSLVVYTFQQKIA
jgi:two-component system, NarL family, nitrate/nitrite response regulator NarL